jgi:adenosylmethionine-8-amino-7-oxononanoate aminotransferase
MTNHLSQLDHAHVWHPFTPMRQWRGADPLIIERGDGPYLFDTAGNRYIDGVSSLWCNVHGHGVPQIDQAIRDQLDKIAHTTLLGMGSCPSIELAARLCDITPGNLNKVFYSDAGSTAVEVAFKMAVGYWHHSGQPEKTRFIGFEGAYHGDTTGSMSVGYCEQFHRPFAAMVFPTYFAPVGDISALEVLLKQHADEVAALVIEPIMQGAAGMIAQPLGFLRAAADLAHQYNVLLIADEVATGFGRTGKMFACEHEQVQPDIMCLAKGITGGYLPLAATLATDPIEAAFQGDNEQDRTKTLYHGHTYTGNPLACAAALASLDLFESTHLLNHINQSSQIIADRLRELDQCPLVNEIRQRGIMVGLELSVDNSAAATICTEMRPKGLIIRNLGNVIVLMPIPAMAHDILHQMLDIVIQTLIHLGDTETRR